MDKLGLHIIEGYSGQLGQPRLVKLVDVSPEYVAQVRAEVGPECLIIVRWVAGQSLDAPEYRAQEWVKRYRDAMQAMAATGSNIAFEGYNEVPDHQAEQYVRFELERLQRMHAAGLHAVVGNFSVGTPDLPTWAAYRPMLDEMQDGDWLGLHEYWSDSADLSNMWHVGRWRLVPELDGIPIVVTECGRDVVEGQGAAGWRRTCNADEFLADLRVYNSILMEQDRVLGATVFTGGRIYEQWRHFDVNDIWPRVVAEYNPHRYADQQPAPAPQPPKPEPQPRPEPAGFPRIERVCFPMRNIQKAWYESSQLYGPYDGHPERAEDYNLESMGNTDLGEPLVAPFRGLVICAKDFGGGHGKVLAILGVDRDGTLVVCRMKHLHTFAAGIRPGVWVEAGQDVGTIGNAGGYYAGAHLHLEIVTGAVPGPVEDWRNPAYQFVQPSAWLQALGVDRALVERLRKYDKR